MTRFWEKNIFRNEHDSSKIAQETPPEIQKRIFWCYKNFPKKNFWLKFHRK